MASPTMSATVSLESAKPNLLTTGEQTLSPLEPGIGPISPEVNSERCRVRTCTTVTDQDVNGVEADGRESRAAIFFGIDGGKVVMDLSAPYIDQSLQDERLEFCGVRN